MADLKKHSLYKPMEVDSVISNVFSLYFKTFFPLVIYSFVGVFIIQAFLYTAGYYEVIKSFDPTMVESNIPFFLKLVLKLFMISLVVYGIMNAFIINYLYVKDLDSNASFGSIMGDSIRLYSIHMVFFMILTVLIIFLGMIFGVFVFIVGMFVAAFYLGAVLIPGCSVIVVEQKNAFDAIVRSFSLTHNDFWQSILSFFLFILIMIFVSMVLSAIIAIPVVIMFFDRLSESKNILDAFNLDLYEIGIWSVLLNSLVSAIVYPLYSIFSFVIYFKLRNTQDRKMGINLTE